MKILYFLAQEKSAYNQTNVCKSLEEWLWDEISFRYKNERKAYQNISHSKLFLRVINEAVLLDTVTGVEIFFPV